MIRTFVKWCSTHFALFDIANKYVKLAINSGTVKFWFVFSLQWLHAHLANGCGFDAKQK